MTLHQATPAELIERNRLARTGQAFLIARDGDGAQLLIALDPELAPLALGRADSADIQLAWDPKISRVHAELLCVSGQWTLSDNGLSSNGTFVNRERISGRRRLDDGDSFTLGATELLFRAPQPLAASPAAARTAPAEAPQNGLPLSEAQRKVAVALCRPFGREGAIAMPAANQEIADELHLTVATVKTHLRALFQRFGLEDLPQNMKRRRLVEILLESYVSAHELRQG